MAKIISVTAWKIYGPSGTKIIPPTGSPIVIGVTVTDRDDVREQFPRDPEYPSIYSIITKMGNHGNIPVQYKVQETVGAIIALANA